MRTTFREQSRRLCALLVKILGRAACEILDSLDFAFSKKQQSSGCANLWEAALRRRTNGVPEPLGVLDGQFPRSRLTGDLNAGRPPSFGPFDRLLQTLQDVVGERATADHLFGTAHLALSRPVAAAAVRRRSSLFHHDRLQTLRCEPRPYGANLLATIRIVGSRDRRGFEAVDQRGECGDVRSGEVRLSGLRETSQQKDRAVASAWVVGDAEPSRLPTADSRNTDLSDTTIADEHVTGFGVPVDLFHHHIEPSVPSLLPQPAVEGGKPNEQRPAAMIELLRSKS